MEIKSDVYQLIIKQQPQLPPETGGILGGDGAAIFAFEPDEGRKVC